MHGVLFNSDVQGWFRSGDHWPTHLMLLCSAKNDMPNDTKDTQMPPLPEPLELIWPSLHSEGLGCGVEDQDIYDKYSAAQYGWQVGFDAATASALAVIRYVEGGK